MNKRPIIPLPPAQTGDKEGTWAYFTLSERFRTTAFRTISENNFSGSIEKRITNLIQDIPCSPLRYIQDQEGPDQADWNLYIDPYLGENWRTPPWFLTEHYFYRRILEAIGYFGGGKYAWVDPFSYQKKRSLSESLPIISGLLDNFNHLQDVGQDQQEIFNRILFMNLWGNQADLSLWPMDEVEKPDHTDTQQASKYILIDHSSVVGNILFQNNMTRIDFLIDNAGFELLCDLVLVDFLITNNAQLKIYFHLKAYPTYVSDATIADVVQTVEVLMQDTSHHICNFGKRINEAIETNQLVMLDDAYWNSPLEGWKMPQNLYTDIKKSDLVISKGDAHYRRLLGDRYWSFDASFSDIMAYFPAPILVLRTSKSELMVGLTNEKVMELYAEDPTWLINGRWGIIQSTLFTE